MIPSVTYLQPRSLPWTAHLDLHCLFDIPLECLASVSNLILLKPISSSSTPNMLHLQLFPCQLSATPHFQLLSRKKSGVTFKSSFFDNPYFLCKEILYSKHLSPLRYSILAHANINSLLTCPRQYALTPAHYLLSNICFQHSHQNDPYKTETSLQHSSPLNSPMASHLTQSKAKLMKALHDLPPIPFPLWSHLFLPSSLTKPQLWPPCCSLYSNVYSHLKAPHDLLTHPFSKAYPI